MNPLAALAREGREVTALAKRVAEGRVPPPGDLAGAALLVPLAGASHDPVHHAEGDPLVHTHMVAEELVRLNGFAALADDARLALSLAALLHDVAKPQTVDVVDGRVSHPNHAPRGARVARAALYAAGLDPSVREATAALCRRHMQPHHALASRANDASLLRWMAATSLDVPMRLLLMLAEADARGRAGPKTDDSAAVLRLFAEEHDLLDRAWTFADLPARRDCCRDAPRDPRFPTGAPEGRPTVTVLSGLPASGKSSAAREVEAERISVEDLLSEGWERGRAVQACRERLREALREKRDAVWDATMLTRTLRRQVVSLAEDYGARAAIACVEVPEEERAARNRERASPVPDAAVADMLASWEMPTFDEALVVTGRPARLETGQGA